MAKSEIVVRMKLDAQDITDVALLRAICEKNDAYAAPRKTERYVPFKSVLIAVDKDHTAEIVMDDETYEILMGNA